jgi:hypothetical protein
MTDGEYLLLLFSLYISARRSLAAEIRWRRREAMFADLKRQAVRA